MTISRKVVFTAAVTALVSAGAFSQVSTQEAYAQGFYAQESRTAPHASRHPAKAHDVGAAQRQRETTRAPDAAPTECWHRTDPDRGSDRGFGYMGPGPC